MNAIFQMISSYLSNLAHSLGIKYISPLSQTPPPHARPRELSQLDKKHKKK